MDTFMNMPKENPFEIKIDLDPVEDGAIFCPGNYKVQGKKALIIATNGEYRLADESEVMELMNRLAENVLSVYMGKSSYMICYNTKKTLKTCGSEFFVGSAIILKGTKKGVMLLDEEEIPKAVAEFESRLVTLCGGGIEFSAYEL